MISAEHSKDGNVLSQLKESDDVRVDTNPGDDIALTFTGCSGEEFSFTTEGHNPWGRALKTALSLTPENITVIIFAVILALIIPGIVFFVFKHTIK